MDEKDYVIDMLTERILEMKKLIQELNDDNDRLASLNRHYLFHFFGGDVMKMKADFHYLAGDRQF